MTDRLDGHVKFDNVGLRYGTDPEVLSNLSFTLYPGSFYFLTGASGAGKTSLLKLLYLAQRPSRGAIRMFGQDLMTMPRERLPDLRRRHGVERTVNAGSAECLDVIGRVPTLPPTPPPTFPPITTVSS